MNNHWPTCTPENKSVLQSLRHLKKNVFYRTDKYIGSFFYDFMKIAEQCNFIIFNEDYTLFKILDNER